MLEFKEYQSKPVTRLAMEILEGHNLQYTASESKGTVMTNSGLLQFACHEEPHVGDFVCYLTESDVYHCNRAVFKQRNVV